MATDTHRVIDSYQEGNDDDIAILYQGSADGFYGQSFRNNSGRDLRILSIELLMYRAGSPPGDCHVRIYEHTGTFGTSSKPTGDPIAQAVPVDASTLPLGVADKALIRFNFSGPNRIKLKNGKEYCLVVFSDSTESANAPRARIDISSPTHGGNGMRSSNGLSWTSRSGDDMVFYVHSEDMTSGWKVRVLNSAGKRLATLIRARDIRVGLKLSGTPSASFVLDIDDPKADDTTLSTGVNDIEIERNGNKIFRGRIWNKTKNYDEDNGEVRVDAYGYFALLDKRLAGKDEPREFADADAGTIVSTLISESQAETGGNLGITIGTIQTSTTRTRSYRYKRISEAITELADAETGFDFEITPANIFNVYYPFQGSTKRNIIFKYPGAIERVEQIDQSGEIVNFRVGLGKAFGETEIRTRSSDATSITTYGRREDVSNYRDVDNVTTLGNMISGDILRSKNLVAVYRITVNQDSSNYEWGDWDVGDSVVFKVETDKWNLDKALRILSVDFQVDDEGREIVIFTTGEVGGEGVAGGANRPTEIPSIPAEIAEIKARIEKTELNQPRGNASVIVAPDGDDGDFIGGDGIQSAINFVNGLGGGTVLIKAGTYDVTEEISITSNIYLRGESPFNTIIRNTGTSRAILIDGGFRTNSDSISLTNGDATVTGSGSSFVDDGVQVGDVLFVRDLGVEYMVASVTDNTHLEITENYQGDGISGAFFTIYDASNSSNIGMANITIDGSAVEAGSFVTTVVISEGRNITLENVIVTGSLEGDDLTITDVANYKINNCIFKNASDRGIAIGGGYGVLSGVYGNKNGGYGIYISSSARLIGCQVVANGSDGIFMEQGGNNAPLVEGCFISGNAGSGVIVVLCEGAQVLNNRIVNNGFYGIEVGGGPDTSIDTIISANYIDGNTSGDISDSGTGTIRATRFVPISTPVSLVTAADPANTNWNNVDVTANTSARCYAISVVCLIKSATTVGRVLYVAKNGDDTTATTLVAQNPATAVFGFGACIVEVDADQVFQWSVNNADVNSVSIIMNGYFEYVD